METFVNEETQLEVDSMNPSATKIAILQSGIQQSGIQQSGIQRSGIRRSGRTPSRLGKVKKVKSSFRYPASIRLFESRF